MKVRNNCVNMFQRFGSLPGLSLCSIISVFAISGYLGVSDADVVLRGNEYQIPSSYYEKELFQSDDYPLRQLPYYSSKHRKKEADVFENDDSSSHGVNESLWNHVVQAALTNPLDWKELRQALDLMEKDMHEPNQGENITEKADLNNQTEKESSVASKFTYHRVLTPSILNSGRRRMSAITAMSLNPNTDKNIVFSREESFENIKQIREDESKHYFPDTHYDKVPTLPVTSVPSDLWEESSLNKQNNHIENPLSKNRLQVHFAYNKPSSRSHHHQHHQRHFPEVVDS